MAVGLDRLIPKPLRTEKVRFESTLSPEELKLLMQLEFRRQVHSKEERKLIGEFAADRFKLWCSCHLNEVDEGRSLVPSVLMEGVVLLGGAGSVVQTTLRPHWSSYLIVVMLLAIGLGGFLHLDDDWMKFLPIIPLVILLLMFRNTAQNKYQLRSFFTQCFDLNEVDRPH